MTKALELAKFGRETPPTGVVVGDTDLQTLSQKTFADGPVFSSGAVNAVPYLNASKVFSTSATFVFDGTNLGIGTANPAYKLQLKDGAIGVTSADGTVTSIINYNSLGTVTNSDFVFNTNSIERARISSSGLAVTGHLSASGTIVSNNVSGTTQFRSGIGTDVSLATGEGLELLTTATTSTRVLSYSRTAGAFRTLDLAGSNVRMSPNNSTVGEFSSSGLTVTGTVTVNQNSTGVAAAFVNSDATNGYGVYIHAGGSSATRYALVVRDPAGNQDYFKISTVTGEVGHTIFRPGAYPSPEIARFTSTGLGIGTPTPAHKLDVNGTSIFRDTLNFGSGGMLSWTSGYSDGTTQTFQSNTGGSLALITNGSLGLFVKSNQNVGVGTSDPQDKLDVSGNIRVGQGQVVSNATVGVLGIYSGMTYQAGNAQLKFFGRSVDNTGLTYELGRISSGSLNSPYTIGGGLMFSTAENNGANVMTLSERMRITATGQLLFGTTATPMAGSGAGVYINGVSNQQTDIASLFVSGAKIGFAGIQSLIQNQLTIYDSTAGNGTGTGGAITFGGNAGAGQATFYAAIESRKDNGTAGDYGASLNFYTRPTGGYYTTPNMIITSTGNLLLNTASQSYSGKIIRTDNENSPIQSVLVRNNNSGNLSACSYVLNSYGNSWGIEMGSTARNSNALTFIVDALDTRQEKMRLTTSGNLGIGLTTDPQDKLHVAGAIRSNASTTGTLHLGQTSGGATYVAAALVATPSTIYAPVGKLSFRLPTHGANTDYGLTEQMLIEGTGADSRGAYKMVMLPHGGNVGIGTGNASPAHKLSVEGGTTGTTTFLHTLIGTTHLAGTAIGIGFKPEAGAGVRVKAALVYEGNNEGYDFGDFHFLQRRTTDQAPADLTNKVMTIKSNGTVLVGTTSTSGSVSNYANILAGVFKSFNGTTASTNSGTYVTLFTAPAGFSSYIVTVWISADDCVNYQANIAVNTQPNGSVKLHVLVPGNLLNFQMSGYNVQVQQNSGGAATINYQALRIGG